MYEIVNFEIEIKPQACVGKSFDLTSTFVSGITNRKCVHRMGRKTLKEIRTTESDKGHMFSVDFTLLLTRLFKFMFLCTFVFAWSFSNVSKKKNDEHLS